MTSSTVKVAELVGREIQGQLANVVNPAYRYQYERCPDVMVKTLIRAEFRTHDGHRWLYLIWEKNGSMSDCGYSGWRDDHDGTPTVELIGGVA